MRRHCAVGPIDLRVIKRGLMDAALEIVGNQQLGRAAEKAEHAHMRAGPVRQDTSGQFLALDQLQKPWIATGLLARVPSKDFRRDVTKGTEGGP